MASPEMGSREGMEGAKPQGEYLITFPDGSIGKFQSREQAAQALSDWREGSR